MKMHAGMAITSKAMSKSTFMPTAEESASM
jgi:hypothetical protein